MGETTVGESETTVAEKVIVQRGAGTIWQREVLGSSPAALPEAGSLYFDYLRNFPIGLSMEMDLLPDSDELEPDDLSKVSFHIKKVAHDAWDGVPGFDDLASDRALFSHVACVMDGEESILVSHGCDPRKVKREMSERDEVEQQEFTYFSINEVIDLDSESEQV